jgi:hypothetical protein
MVMSGVRTSVQRAVNIIMSSTNDIKELDSAYEQLCGAISSSTTAAENPKYSSMLWLNRNKREKFDSIVECMRLFGFTVANHMQDMLDEVCTYDEARTRIKNDTNVTNARITQINKLFKTQMAHFPLP